MKTGLIFLIFAAGFAHADPGCLKAIQGKAINERAAKLLPKDCQEFRKSYLKGLKLLSKNANLFSHELAQQIKAKRSFEPPYHALLLSVFPKERTKELLEAIRSRAGVETARKVKYKYAVAALERIEKGSCSAAFSEAAYDEVCHANDAAYERIEKLRGAQ